ncbi:transcription termination factor NusA [Patescibacteria group bacterium]|nr:transcription termination factor NusA [Patescibacteria group bacterium]
MQTPRTEFAQALKAIATERGLEASVILDTIKQAIIAAYRRDAHERGEDAEEIELEAEIDPISGEAKVFTWPTDKPEERQDVTPPGFGRIAAQTAKQVIHQKIREAEKGAIMDEFSQRIGNLISGTILRFDGPDVRVDIGRTEAIMPADERIPNERLSANQRLTFLLKEIRETPRGKTIILSRSDPEFVSKLFSREVPEVNSGSVEVKAIAREAGVRTKVSVSSNQSGVDPVGSCVGQKGVRVQAVTNELGGERVDIIPWNEKVEEFIKAALAPAEGLSVNLEVDEEMGVKIASVSAPEDQLSLAIGKDGQNVRLAAKLTGFRIEIEGIPGEEEKPETETEKVEKKEAVSEDKQSLALRAKRGKSKLKSKSKSKKEEKKPAESSKDIRAGKEDEKSTSSKSRDMKESASSDKTEKKLTE